MAGDIMTGTPEEGAPARVLGVVGRDLVLDVEGARRFRGGRAVVYPPHGEPNQCFFLDSAGRLGPGHAPQLCLDAKDDGSDGAPLVFWSRNKAPGKGGTQAFTLDTDGFLACAASGLVAGCRLAPDSADTGSAGGPLLLCAKDSSFALRWEWRPAGNSAAGDDAAEPSAPLPPLLQSADAKDIELTDLSAAPFWLVKRGLSSASPRGKSSFLGGDVMLSVRTRQLVLACGSATTRSLRSPSTSGGTQTTLSWRKLAAAAVLSSSGGPAVCEPPTGDPRQCFYLDPLGRLKPKHDVSVCLDCKGGRLKAGTPLIFWQAKEAGNEVAAPNQAFHLSADGYLVASQSTAGGGDDQLVVGANLVSQELLEAIGIAREDPGCASLHLCLRGDPKALQWDWRPAPTAGGAAAAQRLADASARRRRILKTARRLAVTIPPGLTPGTILCLHAPAAASGLKKRSFFFQVPFDAAPGATVEVVMPVSSLQDPKAAWRKAANVVRATVGLRLRGEEASADVEAGKKATSKLTAVELFNEVDYPNGDGDLIKASLNTELTWHELTLVVWRKRSTVFRCDMATIAPALFQFLDQDMDGRISITEILGASAEPKLIEFIAHINCPVLMRLFEEREAAMLSAFRRIDKDLSGDIGEEEWMAFLRQVQMDRLLFYRQRFLLKGKVYAGLGMEPGEPVSRAAFVALGLPRGFWEDFKYFACNNHPLLLMWYADDSHPYSVGNRRAEFCGAMVTSFAGAGFLLNLTNRGFLYRSLYSVACVTVPVALFRKVAYVFFAAPCMVHDRSKVRSKKLGKSLAWAEVCSNAVGYTVTLVLCFVFIQYGLREWDEDDSTASDYLVWALSVAEYWLVWFLVVLCFDFNPLPSSPQSPVGRALNGAIRVLSCGQLNLRVGRWHLERALVHGIVRGQVEARGAHRFFLPVQHDLAVGEGKFTVTVVNVPEPPSTDAGELDLDLGAEL